MTDWNEVLSHPEVEPYTLCGMASVSDFLSFCERSDVMVEEYAGGGIIYVDKPDGHELHIMFLPQEWGKPVSVAVKKSLDSKARSGVSVIVREQEGYWKSRPPRSYGFVPVGDFEISTHPRRLRKWMLTPEAWYRSPVGRKYNEHHC